MHVQVLGIVILEGDGPTTLIRVETDGDTLTVHGYSPWLQSMAESGPRAEISAARQGRSSPDIVLILGRAAPFARPVDLALSLKTFGVKLRDAHLALDSIVADEVVTLKLGHADRATMIARLAELGVAAD